MSKGAVSLVDAFKVEGVYREEELNASIGRAGQDWNFRKALYQALKNKIVRSNYFVSATDEIFHPDLLRQHGLPENLLDGVSFLDKHRTNDLTTKVNFDTFGLNNFHNGISIQVEGTTIGKFEQCAKISERDGSSRVRAEIETAIQRPYPHFGKFSDSQRSLLEERAGQKLKAKEHYAWFATAGNNWMYTFHPAGEKDTIIKAKLDMRKGTTALNGIVEILNAELEMVKGNKDYLDEAFAKLLSMKFNGKPQLFEEKRTKAEIAFGRLDERLKRIREAGGIDVLKSKMEPMKFTPVTGVPGYDC